jgi:exopolysaccharide/PEP-CTERM locus tyrosine autokinase
VERIKQALERARAERQGKSSVSAVAGKTTTPAADPIEISYTQTRHAEVSSQHLRKHRIVASMENSPFADAYKLLRTQVLQRLKENNWSVLAVTSPGVGEGKTVTALNLAASIAMEVDRTVLLVDANLRHPNLHEHLGIDASKGLSDYLLDDTPISELFIHPKGIDHLTILPGGQPVQNSAEILNSPRMTHLLEEMKARYPGRIIIFDLPPLLTAADALAFTPYVDAVLLVVEEGKTTQNDTARAVEMLSNTNVLGTVLNKKPT